MRMYKYIHEVIREKAVECKNTQLIKFLDNAKKNKLTVIYAYNKQWQKDGELMPHIEILDEYTYNKYDIRLTIVRNSKEVKVNNERTIIKNETKECMSYDIKMFKKLIKRFQNLYDFAIEVQKLDLSKLPIMSSFK